MTFHFVSKYPVVLLSMSEWEYLPENAPFVETSLFRKSPSPNPVTTPKRHVLSSQGSSLLEVSSLQSPSFKLIGTSRKPAILSSAHKLGTAENPYLPSSAMLGRFLSAPSAHLTPAGLFHSSATGDFGNAVTPQRLDGSGPLTSLKTGRIDSTGKRLPSVLKKPVPLPPEDIRSVPHMRPASNPLGSPPVVSIGMADIDGVPIPWDKQPELIATALETLNIQRTPQTPGIKSLGSPAAYGADDVRRVMREDFDNLELLIEQVFNNQRNNIVTPSVNEELIFEQS